MIPLPTLRKHILDSLPVTTFLTVVLYGLLVGGVAGALWAGLFWHIIVFILLLPDPPDTPGEDEEIGV